MSESFQHHPRAAERLLNGQVPALHAYLAQIKSGNHRPDSTIHAIQQEMVKGASGLLVPLSAVRPAQPIDQVLVYLSAEEVFGQPMDPEFVAAAISSLSVEHAVSWAAQWLAWLDPPGHDRREADAAFVQQYLAEPHRTRILNILRDPTRVLVVPQALMALIKHALLYCRSRGIPSSNNDDGDAALALLCLTSVLGPDGDVDGDLVLRDTPGELGRELIANQVFNARRDLRGIWAMFERCWRELPAELADDPRMVDLPTEYKDATGIPLDDLVAICSSLWASAGNGRSTIPLDYFRTLGWTIERLNRVLALVSASPQHMQKMVSTEIDQYGIQWSTRSFDHYPVVRWPTGHITIISPTHVVRRASGQWPLFDILRELEGRNQKKRTGSIRGAAAFAYETGSSRSRV